MSVRPLVFLSVLFALIFSASSSTSFELPRTRASGQEEQTDGDLAWRELRRLASRVTMGMTQDEVIEILGPPPRRASPMRFEKSTWDSFWYPAPRARGRNREVRIDFDPERVTKVEELPYEQIPFDSADWKQSSERRRGFMIDDLLHHHDFEGGRMRMEHVVELVGPPDPDPYFLPDEWIYCLGLERSLFAGDNAWLVIEFDEEARTESAYVTTD